MKAAMRRAGLYVSLFLSYGLGNAAFAQDAPKADGSQRILYGFVPDASQLNRIKGERLKQVFAGKTLRGIYRITPHDDQRFVEQMTQDGKIDYTEGRFRSTGRWQVEGDRLCFYYDEDTGNAHCFYEYEYGDCYISYPASRQLIAGRPAVPARWGSVQQFTAKDFSWPATSGGSQNKTPFVCQALTS